MEKQEIDAILSKLNRAEKAELAGRLVGELLNTWPGIEKTPGVAGGEACITRTRIPVWVVENYRRVGWSEAEILENYPSLRAADLVNAWSYAGAHREEIDSAIRANQED